MYVGGLLKGHQSPIFRRMSIGVIEGLTCAAAEGAADYGGGVQPVIRKFRLESVT